MTVHLLELENLSKRFHASEPCVVDDLTFAVEQGEIFALLGPSGCGKTTSLRLIAGLERADAGKVLLGGQVLASPTVHCPPEKRGIGFVFQDYALFPHLSVLENTAFGLRSLPKSERRERAVRALQLVRLDKLAHRSPQALSGGEQQRVAIARAIAPSPRLLLLDEPFSHLDPSLRTGTREEIRALFKREGVTAILVTHDQSEAFSFADRVAVMDTARIVQLGTPEDIYRHPKTPFVARFLGATNVLDVRPGGRHADTCVGRVPLDRECDAAAAVSIRPEQLRLEATAPNQATGTIRARDYRGSVTRYSVLIGDTSLIVDVVGAAHYRVGDEVAVTMTGEAVVLEDGNPPAGS